MTLRGLIVAALALAACNVDPYTLNLGGDGDGGNPGDVDADLSQGDGGGPGPDAPPGTPDAAPMADACVPVAESCNTVDDNCNGMVDEGFNLQADPNNCGTCGNACIYNNGFGACTTGTCAFTGCKPGFIDTDPNVEGCEYACIPTNGGVEICDHVDNDCDLGLPNGGIDENQNVDTDVNNCGACGFVCTLLHATPACVDPDGNGLGQCVVASCDPGFVDNNPAVPGCEYQCNNSNGGVEACDGVDNDCDGVIDDGNPGGGTSCGTSTGICNAGTNVCSFGALQCTGATGGNPEICNELDDDCDGIVDEPINKQTDPNHCGSCSPCNLPFATPQCTLGVCGVQVCQFGHFNNDTNQQNGCEYACIQTGTELCDSIDNDCDLGLAGGGVDEGFDKQTDPSNCGTCGNTCAFPNAAATCVAGGCQQGACNTNFHDLNPAIPGCEYACTKSNGGVEICDNLDNDCDGTSDEGNPGGGVACGTSTGECSTGTTTCSGGQLNCVGSTGPTIETCDNQDDDCDSVVDDGFDKQNDPRFCGTNCTACAFPNAIPSCTAGVCGILVCRQGFVNANGTLADGCEYACTPSGVEICDGEDNDCDLLVDAADPGMATPPNFCDPQGPCAGTTPTCTGAGGFDCVYTNPGVQLDGNGDLVLEESRCDGIDNDCDGGADESFPLKNSACAEDGTFSTTFKVGACRGTGTLTCNVAQTALRCSVTTAGATAANEICDNKDNDCDGKTDESWSFGAFTGVPDGAISIVAGGLLGTYRIFDFEASRPDALAGTSGFVETRACSVTSRLPWQSADFVEATSACRNAGMRLCRVTRTGCSGAGASLCCTGAVTADEWGRACQADGGAAPLDTDYPYGAGYVAATCNGSDFDPVAGGVNEDQAVASGAMASCTSVTAGVNDLSGNLKEWVNDPRCAGSTVVHTLRGGSFDNGSGGLTCDFSFSVAETDYDFPNVGFRCCSSCAAGQADCGGASPCKALADDEQNCGGCGITCGGGQTCLNGTCCGAGTIYCGGVCCAGTCSATGQCQ